MKCCGNVSIQIVTLLVLLPVFIGLPNINLPVLISLVLYSGFGWFTHGSR